MASCNEDHLAALDASSKPVVASQDLEVQVQMLSRPVYLSSENSEIGEYISSLFYASLTSNRVSIPCYSS